jgi:hypothetical protein
VGASTALLAVAAIVGHYRDAHPDRAERRAERERAQVDAALWRYERQAAARARQAERDKG